MQNPRDEADRLLNNIAINSRLLEIAQVEAAREIEQLKKRHAPQIDLLSRTVAECEKALEKLVKKQRSRILGGRDRIDLANGAVMLKREKRVKRIKGMLARLKKAGLEIAVKISKEIVDWDQVEKFNDATLDRLGTERIEKDHFSYELKPRKGE